MVRLLSAACFFCFIASAYAMDVTFTWDKSEDEGVAGYKIYYKAGCCCYPYNATHPINTDLDSPITVLTEDLADPDNPEYTLTGLDPSRTYFCVATTYYNDGSESGFSNEESTDNSEASISTSPVSGGGCFIATAVYGSPMSSKVKILCQFRDRCLKTNSFGKGLIYLYERYSPYLASRISKIEYLKSAVRWALWPAIGVAYVTVQTSLEQKLIIMLVIMMMVCSLVVFFFKRKWLRAAHYRASSL